MTSMLLMEFSDAQTCGVRDIFDEMQYETSLDQEFQKFHDSMTASNIDNNLRYFTSTTHMCGSSADQEQANYISSQWKRFGLTDVAINRYDVLVSLPNVDQPSKMYLLDENGNEQFATSPWENEDFKQQGELPAFLAFCPAATVTMNELVYVNYGREEDFRLLAQMGVSVSGRLVLVRFGASFRGNKVLNAQRAGAAGVVIYTDPADYASPNPSTLPYPDSFWLPDTGIQRGTVTWLDGDPLTYGYPATDDAFRNDSRPTANMPQITCLSISGKDAQIFFQQMEGVPVPPGWTGALPVVYRVGPQLINKSWSVRLSVNNYEKMVSTYNVLGFIRGDLEPDRYVILGNHRDAWTYGALDPSSATATLMEIARATGEMSRDGWSPRRSLLFGSWGCGEYGYYGANEFVEQYIHLLRERTVAHLNVDLAIVYTYNLFVAATPLLHNITAHVATKVAAPEPSLGFSSLYDHWRAREKEELFKYHLGSPSEHWSFYQQMGVPTAYMMWEIDYDLWSWNDFPLYHSSYETYQSMRYLDPEYRYHLALGRLWGGLALVLSSSRILPYNPITVAEVLRTGVDQLRKEFGPSMKQHQISLESLIIAIEDYEQVVRMFQCERARAEQMTDLEVRRLNDRLVAVEKSFIDPNGLQEDVQNKNAIFGTDQFDEYKGVLLPDVRDTIISALRQRSTSSWQRVKRAIAAAAFVVRSAASQLRPAHAFID